MLCLCENSSIACDVVFQNLWNDDSAVKKYHNAVQIGKCKKSYFVFQR